MTKIGRFEIVAKLGQGGFGTVYKGRDPVLNRTAAIKVMNQSAAADKNLTERFRREAEAAGGLNHPSIITIYDLGEHDGLPYIAMEYLEGDDLSAIIARRADIALDQRVEIIARVADALHFAHQRNVVHRDIKPSNIRLMPDGKVKIMDFGIAKMSDSQMTRTGHIMGTVNYLAPEQLLRGATVDHRGDQFSLAVTAYELFTFRRPFAGDDLSSSLYSIAHEVPTPLIELRGTAGEWLDLVVMRGLEKDPSDRWPNCGEFAAALRSKERPSSTAPDRSQTSDSIPTVYLPTVEVTQGAIAGLDIPAATPRPPATPNGKRRPTTPAPAYPPGTPPRGNVPPAGNPRGTPPQGHAPPPGSPPQGYYPPPGTPPQGYYPPPGTAPQGYYPPPGTPPQGYYQPPGTAPQGYYPPPGTPPQGYYPPPGTPPQGYYPPPGTPTQGYYPPPGTPTQGYPAPTTTSTKILVGIGAVLLVAIGAFAALYLRGSEGAGPGAQLATAAAGSAPAPVPAAVEPSTPLAPKPIVSPPAADADSTDDASDDPTATLAAVAATPEPTPTPARAAAPTPPEPPLAVPDAGREARAASDAAAEQGMNQARAMERKGDLAGALRIWRRLDDERPRPAGVAANLSRIEGLLVSASVDGLAEEINALLDAPTLDATQLRKKQGELRALQASHPLIARIDRLTGALAAARAALDRSDPDAALGAVRGLDASWPAIAAIRAEAQAQAESRDQAHRSLESARRALAAGDAAEARRLASAARDGWTPLSSEAAAVLAAAQQPATPPPAAPPPTTAAAPSADADRAAIDTALRAYADAIQAEDIAALKRVWPGISGTDEKKIAGSFQFARSHEIALGQVRIQQTGDTAIVSCARHDSIQTEDGQTVSNTRQVTFQLRRQGSGWIITSLK